MDDVFALAPSLRLEVTRLWTLICFQLVHRLLLLVEVPDRAEQLGGILCLALQALNVVLDWDLQDVLARNQAVFGERDGFEGA